jgi:predicted nuclease of predicted toxin-antitoxin system
MKALLDMPVSPGLLEVLQEFGHDGVHCCQIDKSTATDSDLLELARHEGRVIIRADSDFPRLPVT